MKKTKIITISLLGLLLLVPFMTPTRAAPSASFLGVTEGEKYEWALNVYPAAYGNWIADNMTDSWQEPWGLTATDSNLTQIFSDWAWDSTPPQSVYVYTIDQVFAENTTTGTQQINASFGVEMPDYMVGNWFLPNQAPTIGNDTAAFIAATLSSGMFSSPYWLVYNLNVLVAPKNINWTEYAALSNTGLGSGFWWITVPVGSGGWGFNITVSALTNGMQWYVPAGGIYWEYGGVNSQSMTIKATYDSNGLLSYYSFEYGSSILCDVTRWDSDAPIITVSPSDATVANNYIGQNLSWTATDANPDTYTITLNGTTTVVPATTWTSGGAVTYNIPDGLAAGAHTYEITFTDEWGANTASDTVVFTVNPAPEPAAIPGFEPLIVIGITGIAIIGLITVRKKKRNRTIKI
ncbi:hypothetical protein LCGC14_0641160 [marine sediment metagenome]|uniref:Bacterial Ig-like domain-containing protein n=1 Tax=marine sediment metagenome TaxID=412755 RepID=A0A0F9U7G8_9ZZZZ|nr:hypothetical protein [bacterium]